MRLIRIWNANKFEFCSSNLQAYDFNFFHNSVDAYSHLLFLNERARQTRLTSQPNRTKELNWTELNFFSRIIFILEGKTKNILQKQQQPSIQRIRSGYYDLSYNNAQFNFCRSFYKPRKGWWHDSLYANDNTSHHAITYHHNILMRIYTLIFVYFSSL